jgi:hypothetical protein
MRRVVRSGGLVAAAVWDHFGGTPGMRMMIDTVAALSESGRQLRGRYCFQPMMQPGEMKRAFVEQGLVDVTEVELMVRMDYQSFDDYWAPIAAGEGPLGKYVATLDTAERARIDAAVRDAYDAGGSIDIYVRLSPQPTTDESQGITPTEFGTRAHVLKACSSSSSCLEHPKPSSSNV